MAGEKVIPLSKHMVSIEHKLAADGARGDIVGSGSVLGFLLGDGKKDDVVSTCIECDLVLIPDAQIAGSAGTHIIRRNKKFSAVAGNLSGQQRPALIGYLHRDAAANDDHIELVWRHGE